MNTDQRGSVTAISLMFVILLGIVFAGVIPLIGVEYKAQMTNRDAIQASLAADAGAKRAVAMFYQSTQDWSWIDTASTTVWQTLYNNQNEKYHVKITAIPVNPAITGTYTIASTGSVNGITKTVTLAVNVTSVSSGNPPVVPLIATDAAIYAGKSLDVKNGATINGASIDSGGTISTGNNTHIANPYSLYPNSVLSIPQYSSSSYQGYPNLDGNSANLEGGTYYISGDWNINNNTTISGDGIIFVNGNIIFPQNVNFTGKVLIISTGDMDASNSNNVSLNKAALISYGNITAKNTFNLTGAVIAADSVSFKNNVNITYSSDVLSSLGITTANGQPSVSVQTGSWTAN